jgi:hypothetical protein
MSESAVSDNTAMSDEKKTFEALCVELPLGDAQLPVDHPLGNVVAPNSSRHLGVNVPSA